MQSIRKVVEHRPAESGKIFLMEDRTNTLTQLEEQRRDGKMAGARSKNGKMVMQAIETRGRCTTKDICEECGLSSREVGGTLKTLRMMGLVRIVEAKNHSGHIWALN